MVGRARKEGKKADWMFTRCEVVATDESSTSSCPSTCQRNARREGQDEGTQEARTHHIRFLLVMFRF